eukprot:6476401-Amphidinium_carterae.2
MAATEIVKKRILQATDKKTSKRNKDNPNVRECSSALLCIRITEQSLTECFSCCSSSKYYTKLDI